MSSHLKHTVILLSVLRSIPGSPDYVRILRRRTTRLFRTCRTALRPFPHVTYIGRERKGQTGSGTRVFPKSWTVLQLLSYLASFVEESPNSTHNPSNSQHINNSSPCHTHSHHCEHHCDSTATVRGRSTTVTTLLAFVILYLRLLYTHHSYTSPVRSLFCGRQKMGME